MCASPMHRANMFVESDDEEEKKEDEGSSKKARDPYAGSLVLKSSRTPAAGLYYVDYNKAKNGNGLEGNEYNELAAQDATTKAEESALLASINAKTSEAKKLFSEPTNQELALRLDEGESALAKIQGEVEEARKLQVNEKHKNGIKRRRDNMVTQWRKRRRMCMEILINLEELSDGKISSKKCLDGDGQIDIDSDDVVAKYAVEYGKKKRANPVLYKKRRLAMRKTNAPTSSAGLPASEDFVAVKLDSQGQVYRVLLPDEDSK